MINRIAEIRKCIDLELYEAALALALTLPDICGQVELPNGKAGERYRNWIDNYVDADVLYDKSFGSDFIPLSSNDIYKLRCSFLHSGDDDIDNAQIDEFKLLSPKRTDGKYGYRYGIRRESKDKEIHIAEIDIKYLSTMLCDYAEKYYSTKDPIDFIDHTFSLEE